MKPGDIMIGGDLVGRVPSPEVDEGRLGHKRGAFESHMFSVADVIGKLFVDDNGCIRIRKIRPDEPEYTHPDLPVEAKE